MSGPTSIEWTDVSWNPVRGCSRVSEGCRNCYAERMAARFNQEGKPFHGFAKATPQGPRWTGRVDLLPERLRDPQKWKGPRRVFVNSMSDLFHEALPDEAIDRVFAVMAMCDGARSSGRQHTFQVLTKRPARMHAYMADPETPWRIGSEVVRVNVGYRPMILAADENGYRGLDTVQWTLPLPNVWLGVSVEDQATADERIPPLLQTPAAVRFISYEPALGPVGFDGGTYAGPGWLRGWHTEPEHAMGCDGSCSAGRCPEPVQVQNDRLDWVIVGGESGPGARPFDLAWARSVIRQCREASVPCFVKQLGARPRDTDRCESCLDKSICWCVDSQVKLKSAKGDDQAEWPEDLRVREFPR